MGAAINESEMQELFMASDLDGSGKIDYEEFIAAMLDSNRVARRKEAVRRSFEELDKVRPAKVSVPGAGSRALCHAILVLASGGGPCSFVSLACVKACVA